MLAKNFDAPAFTVRKNTRPKRALYFSRAPSRAAERRQNPGRDGRAAHLQPSHAAQNPIKTKSGTVRITDSNNFPVTRTISAALVEVEPGGMRELHWHPNSDEWQYYIEGQARMGVFALTGKARTFDFRAGDVGYVPFAMGHYVENTGNGPLRFLEMFKSARYADVSLNSGWR